MLYPGWWRTSPPQDKRRAGGVWTPATGGPRRTAHTAGRGRGGVACCAPASEDSRAAAPLATSALRARLPTVRRRAQRRCGLHTYLARIVHVTTHSVVRHSQTHAATHTICGLCVPRRRRPVVPLSLRLKRESELQVFCCVLTGVTVPVSNGYPVF